MILVVGENVIDVLPGGNPVAGGGPANTAVALARLDVPCAFAARLGNDDHARLIEQRLTAAGLSRRYWVRTDQASPVAEVNLDETGGARYRFSVAGTADFGRLPGELPTAEQLSGEVDAVHLGSLAAYLPPGADIVEQWLAQVHDTVVVSFDPNIRPAVVDDLDRLRDRTERYARLCHHIRASTEDLTALYGSEPNAVTAKRWLGYGVGIVVVTDGPAATVYHDGGDLSFTAPAVNVIDTVGAGDSFTAGLLAWWQRNGWLRPESFESVARNPALLRPAVEYAMTVAAINCTRPGADPPTNAEVEEFRSRRRPAPPADVA